MPVWYGGLGIAHLVTNSDREYAASKKVTANLSALILQQEQNISLYDKQRTAAIVKELKSAKEAYLIEKYEEIMDDIPHASVKRCMMVNKEK